ncbi:MAG: glycoside hydrolase family 3 C-terminal domain-containing protein [Acidobacteriia bacterium]|nr:glycoside hydrolase family 3 C-terminal domain-containing protein [Terriglobia bacterium]
MPKRTHTATKLSILFLSASALAYVVPSLAGEEARHLPYQDASLAIDQRVNDLVSRMTLEEKVRQMQHTAPAIPRLGVPSYDWWSEALHGVARSGYATVFPQAIGMAATWNAELVHRMAQVIATEARAKYNQAQREGNHSIFFGLDFWSPNINIFRDPRWGRGQETYGEDPFLTAKLGVAFVTGMQGDDPKYFKVIATPKHYAVHSGPEPERHRFNVNVSPHDLEDTYLPAFRATVVEGRADSVMCVYNAVDGVPGCASKYLLQDTLREAWKFQGYVTSDCGAVADITTGHKFTPDNEHGSAVAVQAGTDTTCGDEYVALVNAVREGLIKESEIDTSLKRLFIARFRLGMFDPPDAVSFNKIPFSQNDSPQHRELALQAARESMVLLKNADGILPLKSSYKTIAVVGPNAESLVALEGNYNGVPSQPVYPVEGMRKVFGGKARILFAQGSPYVSQLPVPVPSTVFHTGSEEGSPGLKAEYFPNTDFSGKPVVTRVDPQIQFDWYAAAPAKGIPMKSFAVRWTGTLRPPGPGSYTFSVPKPEWNPHGGKEIFRVYLDAKVVLDTILLSPTTWVEDGGKKPVTTFQAQFEDTKAHAFRLEYVHESPLFGAGATLSWQPPREALRDEAVKAAQQADVVVAFVGLSPGLEGEEMPVHVPGFSGGDRTEIGLPDAEQELLEALAATGKPLVVVLMSGSALAVNWAQERAAAVLEAWYPGEEGGTAIAEALAGANNPGGRLPVTFYAALDQLPPFDDYSMHNRTYRYFQGKPLYGFGYGLSYSTFEYSNLKLSAAQLKAGDDLTVEVDVRNASGPAGDEVAELYLEFPAIPGAPLRALRGFKRLHAAPKETRHVTYTLKARDLSMVNEKGEHIVAPGEYNIFVGGAQPGETTGGVRARVGITGQFALPR